VIVAIEGIDGAGKTALAVRVVELLGARLQKFPDYSTPVGAVIRKMLHADPEQIDPLVLQALQVVNRAEKLDVLRTSPVVICDRYIASGLVYGGADRLSGTHIAAMNQALPRADVNIWLCVPPEVCFDRITYRVQDNQYGQRGLNRMQDLHNRYAVLWEVNRWPVLIPEHQESVNSLARRVLEIIQQTPQRVEV
jgi:thymidylate kinase